jgi:tritrans,polycis-undecaprenyl-diphosphate synthase [geranylgeranyl-diphosphate specific]
MNGFREEMASEITRMISDTAYQAYVKRLETQVESGKIPRHIAIIMDGNRRFARDLGIDPNVGHEKGGDKLKEVLQWCLDVGVKILTVYAFSTENLKRSKEEVDHLMSLFEENFRRIGEDERVHEHGIRVRVLGQRDLLPKDVREAIEYAEEMTKGYDNYFYNIAIAYGGREEIITAIRSLAQDVKDGRISVDKIDEKIFASKLYTADVPDPDLILRTSGEERISNFLLWQLAYSELYFVDVYWPGFRKLDFLRAIRSYQMRLRRYGE